MLNTIPYNVAKIKKCYLCTSNHIEYSIYVIQHKITIYFLLFHFYSINLRRHRKRNSVERLCNYA